MLGSTQTLRESPGFSPTSTTHSKKLGEDLEELLNGFLSDFTISVQGRAYPLHRCILAARCSFFRTYFENACIDESQTELDLGKIADLESVGEESFTAVVKYIYGGRIRLLGSAVSCLDDQCPHEACFPVVKYVLDFLRTASVFNLPELKACAEQHLLNLVEKIPADYVLLMIMVGKTHGATRLQSCCLETLAKDSWSFLNLEKLLNKELAQEVKDCRSRLGLRMPSEEEENREKQAGRVQRALDSDDVELVLLLLKEANVSFDDVQGMHYAAAYCDEKTVRELLELGLLDPTKLDCRGLTVLHIACMRREPEILAGLLSKGARSKVTTPDGRTGADIVKRLTKRRGEKDGGVADEETQKAKLCLEMLEQAEAQTTYSKSFREVKNMLVTSEKELVQKLLYLENRVSLAKVMFPREAQIVISLSHLESTAEFTGVEKLAICDQPPTSTLPLYLPRKELPPRRAVSNNDTSSDSPEPGLDAGLLQRVSALVRAVELGHRFFPRCSMLVNKYMDDDMGDIISYDRGQPEEQSLKKQRLEELKEILAEAFNKDVADMDQQKGSKKLPPSLSSSSSSSQGGSPRMRSPKMKAG